MFGTTQRGIPLTNVSESTKRNVRARTACSSIDYTSRIHKIPLPYTVRSRHRTDLWIHSDTSPTNQPRIMLVTLYYSRNESIEKKKKKKNKENGII